MRGNIVLVPSDGLQMVRLERWTRVRGSQMIQFLFPEGCL